MTLKEPSKKFAIKTQATAYVKKGMMVHVVINVKKVITVILIAQNAIVRVLAVFLISAILMVDVRASRTLEANSVHLVKLDTSVIQIA